MSWPNAAGNSNTRDFSFVELAAGFEEIIVIPLRMPCIAYLSGLKHGPREFTWNPGASRIR
jgi:hypothetical protein